MSYSKGLLSVKVIFIVIQERSVDFDGRSHKWESLLFVHSPCQSLRTLRKPGHRSNNLLVISVNG